MTIVPDRDPGRDPFLHPWRCDNAAAHPWRNPSPWFERSQNVPKADYRTLDPTGARRLLCLRCQDAARLEALSAVPPSAAPRRKGGRRSRFTPEVQAEYVARARALKAQGLTWEQIAGRLESRKSTIFAWVMSSQIP